MSDPIDSPLAITWAQAALKQYALHKPVVRYLGHSDNLTFQVNDTDGQQYLLRLHQPALTYWNGIRQQPDSIRSELAWLEALTREGEFQVQLPVHGIDGALVEFVQTGSSLLPATLLSWLKGEHFSPSAGDGPELIERFGRLVACLHRFSENWSPPDRLVRPVYDFEHFRKIFARLLRGVDLGVFSEETYRLLRAACRKILAVITELPDDPTHWGMIHADLHVGNFLVQSGEIIPIDFSFSGYGHYLFDISVCLAGGLNSGLRPAFLEGYRSVRPLPPEEFPVLDAFVLAGRLSYYAFQIDNPGQRTWLERRIPLTAENECRRLVQGLPIIKI